MGLFKAYDVRGIVPDQLNPNIAFAIGYGFAKHLSEDHPGPRIVVGLDARPSGPGLAAAFMDGVATAGGDARFIGACSTPMLYWAVGADSANHGGAMITASHNPARYNGIKFCRAEAVPIAGETGLSEIEQIAAGAPAPPAVWHSTPTLDLTPASGGDPVAAPLGVHPRLFNGYLLHLRKFVRRMPAGMRVAVDTANGMGGLYLGFLRSLGVEVHAIHGEFDGTFPNHEANPSKLANLVPLQELVKARGCALGIAFDGDADRAVLVDETGTPVGQDIVTAFVASEMLHRHKGASILYDLRSSRIVPETVTELGGRAVRERVGHSYMKATMRKVGCVFGGELAGHYYFKDNWYADSAILLVIEVLNSLGVSGATLSEAISPYRKYAQSGEINFKVQDTAAVFKAVEEAYADGRVDHLDGVTVEYPDWWFNLRASNTEPVVRLNMEARDAALLKEKFAAVKALIGKAE